MGLGQWFSKTFTTAGQVRAIAPPWLPLYDFLLNASNKDLRKFCAHAPAPGAKPWATIRDSKFECLHYALHTNFHGPLDINREFNAHSKQTREWDTDSVTAIRKRYAPFVEHLARLKNIDEKEIGVKWLADYFHASCGYMLMYNVDIVEKPEDLRDGFYLAAFGLYTWTLHSAHLVRLDSTGRWSEKPGKARVHITDTSNPMRINPYFAPVFFLGVPAPVRTL